MRERVPLPDRIQNAPSLMPGLELYYEAFMDLMTSRSTGFGNGPIWWKTVQDYAKDNEFSDDQREDLHYHIREMDTVYMKHLAKK